MTLNSRPVLTIPLTGPDVTDASVLEQVRALRELCTRTAATLPAALQLVNLDDAPDAPEGAAGLDVLANAAAAAEREQQLLTERDAALVRADQLAGALESNRDIGAAIGILMVRHHLTREGAFDLLRRASQERHVKLRDLAREVMDTGQLELASGSVAGRPVTPGQRPPGEPAEAGIRRLRVVVDAVPAMLGYWDRNLRNVLANRAYENWFGLTSRQVHGRHIREVIGDALFTLNEPYLDGALAGEPQHFDRTIVDVTGTPRQSRASYIPDIDDAGTVVGFSVLVADVTQSIPAPAVQA